MGSRILIAAPVQNREWIASDYLSRIYNLDYDKKLIDLYYIINNSKDNTLSIFRDFKKKHQNEYNSITIENYNSKVMFDKNFKDKRDTDIRRKYTYTWLSHLRNKILKKCIKLNCDYLFSVDTDILIKKDLLNRLLEHKKHIVSALIYNGYLYMPKNAPIDYNPIKNAYKYPNIMRNLPIKDDKFNIYNRIRYEHIVNYNVEYPEKNEHGKLLEVDYTGACILISKNVCEKAEYNVNEVIGEDEPFCFSAKESGFKIYCDVSCFQHHCMSEEIYNYFMEVGI